MKLFNLISMTAIAIGVFALTFSLVMWSSQDDEKRFYTPMEIVAK